MHRYSIGQLELECTVALPGFRPAPPTRHAPDLRIERASAAAPGPWSRIHARDHPEIGLEVELARHDPDGASYRLAYRYGADSAEFVIASDGARATVLAGDARWDGEISNLIEGVVVGTALRLGGHPQLHANIVAFDGAAVALIGGSGAGKSTLTWGLLHHGCKLLADDMAPLIVDGARVTAHRGRALLRLWPDSADRLIPDGVQRRLYPEVDGLDKRAIDDIAPPDLAPAALRAIYLLQPRVAGLREPRIAEVGPAEAIATLGSNLYGIIDPSPALRRRELAWIAEIVRRVPVYALTLADDLDVLPAHAKSLMARLFA